MWPKSPGEQNSDTNRLKDVQKVLVVEYKRLEFLSYCTAKLAQLCRAWAVLAWPITPNGQNVSTNGLKDVQKVFVVEYKRLELFTLLCSRVSPTRQGGLGMLSLHEPTYSPFFVRPAK